MSSSSQESRSQSISTECSADTNDPVQTGSESYFVPILSHYHDCNNGGLFFNSIHSKKRSKSVDLATTDNKNCNCNTNQNSHKNNYDMFENETGCTHGIAIDYKINKDKYTMDNICNRAMMNDYQYQLKCLDKMNNKCDCCDRYFTTKQKLAKHKTTHNGEKDLKCNICSKRFSSKKQYIKHMKSIHKIMVPTGKKMTHKCNYCGTRFWSKAQLRQHEYQCQNI